MYEETPYYILEHCTFYLLFDHPHFEWYVINNFFITALFRNFLYLLDKYVFDDISFYSHQNLLLGTYRCVSVLSPSTIMSCLLIICMASITDNPAVWIKTLCR